MSCADARTRRIVFLSLAAVTVFALYLRVLQLNESLWLDELHTAWVVADGPSSIPQRAAMGNQSPAWFFLVWAATNIGGLNEIALRLPSVVAGVGLVVLAFYVVYRWTGVWTAGLFVSLLVALDRNCIFYAQEARPYAWVQLAGLAQIFVFDRLLSRPCRIDRILFVMLSVLLFYLHYTAVLLIAAEVVYYALLHVRRSWRPCYRWSQFLLDVSIAAMCMLPASWHLIDIAARRENWTMFIRKGPLQDIWYLFPLYAYIKVPVIVVAVAYCVRWLVARLPARSIRDESPGGRVPAARSQPARPNARHFLLVGCWLFVPLLLAWVLTNFDLARVFFLRYLIVCLVASLLFSGLAFARCPLPLFRMICVVMVLWMSVDRSGIIEQYRRDGRVIGDRNQDWRAAVAHVNARRAGSNGPIFVRSGLIEAVALRASDDPRLREYCLLPVRGIYRLQCDDDALIPLPIHHSGRLTTADRQRLMEARSGWFLLAGLPKTISRIESELRGHWNPSQGQVRIVEREPFGNVTALRLAIDTE